ncbi:MAG: VapC toxin family PIN domain ribonuclease, partial [Candidatus Margulisbacteria bacterium]|nr:VapC toxin family PIN domain ribonuclease [Candidatus Margulisiibacteriota bacterium]
MSYILDTNIITAILKDNRKLLRKVQREQFRGNVIFINCISYYEIKRGLIAINALKKLNKFEL